MLPRDLASAMRTRAEVRSLAAALLFSLLLWNLPYGGVLLYPFKLLATWLHELSHALVMLLTGAGVDSVIIYADTSGQTQQAWALGPAGTAAIAAAGYMGTPLWGAALLVATPSPRAARIALLVLAGLMLATAVTVIAPTPHAAHFGQLATAAIAAALALAAIALPPRARMFAAHLVAAQACINALLDIRVLLRPLQSVGGAISEHSDAYVMAMATFGKAPPWSIWLWALAWLVWSLAVLFVALRVATGPPTRRSA